MKETIMKKIIALILVMGFGVSAMAEAKFAYVDMRKAMTSTKAGKAAEKKLKKEFERKQKKLKTMEKNVAKMKEDLEKKSLVMSDAVKRRKQAEFQKEYLKLQQMAAQSQQEMQKKQFDMTRPILEKLRGVIGEIAKKEKFDMVFEKSEQSVLWAKSNLDITSKVIKAYDKK